MSARRIRRRLALALLAGLVVSGAASPPARAVIETLPEGQAVSYMPLRGAATLPPADQIFGNLDYNGGPVMPSNTNYVVYWDPAGEPAYPAGYKSGINRYFTDLAHDSGGHENVESVSTQYNDAAGAFAAYDSHFGGELVDEDPYPEAECSEGATCLTKEQIEAELLNLTEERGLPTNLTHEYFVITPPGVETCFTAESTQCSAGSAHHAVFCAFHGDVPTGSGPLIYADDPYVNQPVNGCDDGNHPNESPADGALEGGITHEHNESTTDPEPRSAWTDVTGRGEIGDQCRGVGVAQEFGPSLGTAPNGAKYNQVINGHLYWYQQEWSNETHGCLQRLTALEPRPTAKFTETPAGGLSVTFDASESSSTGGILYYEWQFNDNGNPSDPLPPEEVSEPEITHTFPGPGTYRVALTVFGEAGDSAGTAMTVKVTDLPIAEPGWEVSSFATDFPSTYLGPMGIVANGEGDIFVGDAPAGLLYRFGPGGGSAEDPGAQLPAGPIGYWPLGLAFGKDGALYAVIDGENLVVQVDPETGAVLRTVAEVPVPLGIATDPVSGDLFVASIGDGAVDRISDPAGAEPQVTQYATGLGGPDGISAAPDGTFYTEDDGAIDRIAATDSFQPGEVTTIGYVSGADGIAVGANPFDPAAPSFIAANSNFGFLDKVDLANPDEPLTIFYGGTRGDFLTVAPDGCLYATQVSDVVRVSGEEGVCPFAPISPFQPPEAQPGVPGGVSSDSVEFTATVNPHGAPTTYHFEFGTSASYGQSTPDASAGAGSSLVTVAQTVGGLQPATTYHYRVVAHNQGGTIFGPDTIVTTSAASNDGGAGRGGPATSAAPVDATLPSISGRPRLGRTLKCHPGTWTGALSLSIAWLRDGATIAGGGSYRLRRADVGHRISCEVTASGAGGVSRADSPAVAISGPAQTFSIGLHAPRASTAALRAHGVTVSVTVPRRCTMTLRLLQLRVVGRGPHAKAIAVRHIHFAGAGRKTVHLGAFPQLAAGEILRVTASAKSGTEQSRPASVTIWPSRSSN